MMPREGYTLRLMRAPSHRWPKAMTNQRESVEPSPIVSAW
jgi:hypothetical protein